MNKIPATQSETLMNKGHSAFDFSISELLSSMRLQYPPLSERLVDGYREKVSRMHSV